MSKIGHIIRSSNYNTSYGWKKGWESKCQFDFQPLKVRNCPDLRACKRRATYHWKDLNEGYNFASKLPQSKSTQEVMGIQSGESPNFKNCETLELEFRENCHLGVVPWQITKNNIKEKVVAFPKFRLWWVLWICVCSWLVYAPKKLELCTNQLVWFV